MPDVKQVQIAAITFGKGKNSKDLQIDLQSDGNWVLFIGLSILEPMRATTELCIESLSTWWTIVRWIRIALSTPGLGPARLSRRVYLGTT